MPESGSVVELAYVPDGDDEFPQAVSHNIATRLHNAVRMTL
jgi:hypothetical protein